MTIQPERTVIQLDRMAVRCYWMKILFYRIGHQLEKKSEYKKPGRAAGKTTKA
jgi:hypothetical protein